MAYIDEKDPDVVAIAWPDTNWTQIRNINQKTVSQVQRQQDLRKIERQGILPTIRKIAQWCKRRGKVCIGGNPATSAAWSEPHIIAAFPPHTRGNCDMCRFDKKRPDTQELLRQRTVISAPPEVLKATCQTCCGNHTHGTIKGRMAYHWTDDAGAHKKSIKVSSFAGSYTGSFCKALIKGAEKCLKSHFNARNTFPADTLSDSDNDRLPEERFTSADDMKMDDSYEQDITPGHEASCRDIPRFIKDTVIAAHNRLGHPTRKTLIKMMRLAGSHPQAIRFAKAWNCPTCMQRAAPGKPRATKGEIRPYAFNHTIYIDIKFVQDATKTTYAALSIVDAGTAFHRAVLLRTKHPDTWHARSCVTG